MSKTYDPAEWEEVTETDDGVIWQPDTPEKRKAEAEAKRAAALEEASPTGATLGVNLLDSASLVGVAPVLGFKDAVLGEESAKASSTDVDDTPGFEKLGLMDRYRANRDWYKAGLERAREANPGAAFAGQVAGGLAGGVGKAGVTVAKLGASMGRAGAHGALRAGLGGEADLSKGEVGEALKEAAIGGGLAAGGAALGSAGGRFLKWTGEKAGSRLSAQLTDKVRSILGKYGQRKKDAVQAVKNLGLQEALEAAPRGNSPAAMIKAALNQAFPGAEADLYQASAQNAAKQVRRFVGAQGRHGPSGIPSTGKATDIAWRVLQGAGKRAIKNAAGAGVRGLALGAVGSQVAPAFGYSPAQGFMFGGAVGGASALYATRKTATAIMNHPDILEKMSQTLPGLGSALAKVGGNTGAQVGILTAALATDEGREALNAALEKENRRKQGFVTLSTGQEFNPNEWEPEPQAGDL